jgi:hypothetical protein
VSGRRVVSAEFEPGELYVYYDVGSSAVGFGSRAGGRGYPLALTDHLDLNGLVEWSTVGAVSDLTRVPADAALYTPATATLVTDLTGATALFGAASSCVALDPLTGVCSNLTPVGLRTSAGRFFLFEPYTDDERANADVGPYSINWGAFWSEPGVGCDEDRSHHDRPHGDCRDDDRHDDDRPDD